MAKTVYDTKTIYLIDGTSILMGPLKIKFLREFMDVFDLMQFSENDDQAIMILSECAVVCMKQYYPLITNRQQLEDLIDLPTVYDILNVCAGVKIDKDKEDIDKQAKNEAEERNTWKDIDLPSLEAEIFMTGAWKNFEDLEMSLTMPELTTLLEKYRDLDYNEKRFLAAMQGVDLDKQSGKNNAWEEMKARVFSGGDTSNPNDILALQGQNAVKAGFGIGMGLSYEKIERKDSGL
jgi:hypothetical protein